MIKTTLKWIKKSDSLPKDNDKSVIAYSPKNKNVLLRIIAPEFVRISTDVEYWAYITYPKEK